MMNTAYHVDGAAVVTDDPDRVAARWARLFDAVVAETVAEPGLGATRRRVHVGAGALDILRPVADGVVATAFEKRGDHLFATAVAGAGADGRVATEALEAGVRLTDGSLFIGPEILGLGDISLIIRPPEDRPSVGRLQQWYESTWVVDDADVAVHRVAQLLGVEPANFRELNSSEFRYRGALTLFHPEALSRFEIVRAWDEDTTINRFYRRYGPSLYMTFAECADLGPIAAALEEDGIQFIDKRRTGDYTEIWVPPTALCGVMLGVSVTGEAWRWSRGPRYEFASEPFVDPGAPAAGHR